MTGPTAADPRAQRLARARAAASEAKTANALAAVSALQTAAQSVTFTEVARRARVSTWFCYNKPAVRRAIETAIAEQADQGISIAAAPLRVRVTQSGLEVDLALARHQIKTLKRERDVYKTRAQLSLGTELDDVPRAELLATLTEAQDRVHRLELELATATRRAETAERQAEEIDDQLTAARSSLRKMIRPANGSQHP